LYEILDDRASAYYRDAIVSSALKRDDEDIGKLYVRAIGIVSSTVQAQLNAALGQSREVSNEHLAAILATEEFASHRDNIIASMMSWMESRDFAAVIRDGGTILPDDVLLRLARAMQG
jgi:hypothetical protein